MNYEPANCDLERFRAAIIRGTGLRFDDAKLGFLGEVLARRRNRLDRSGEAYLRDLEREPSRSEISAFAQVLTVGETCFFRNHEQASALLQREDASRLILFGGGFGRAALIALCVQALRDSGGKP